MINSCTTEPGCWQNHINYIHYNDVIMGAITSQITSLTIVYSILYSDADQRKHQSSASLAFVRGIHRGPVNSPHKWPVTRKIFPFYDVIMFDHRCLIAHLRGAIRGRIIIWHEVWYISFKLQPPSLDKIMLLLLYTRWNLQHLLSKNRRRQYDSNKIYNL